MIDHTRIKFKRFNRMTRVQLLAKKMKESGMSIKEIRKEISNSLFHSVGNLYPKVIEW